MSRPVIPGYTLLGPLGSGADATVWKAESPSGDTVALKIIPIARVRDPERHLREVWAAGSTGSRQVVAIHEAGRTGDLLWLSMELAAGDAAGEAASAGGRLDPRRAMVIGRDAGHGLQTLADHGFVHRDVKPGNILLRTDGSAMIGDLAPARGGGTVTRSADLAGTPAFLPPEQVQGLPADARSDVYGLAAAVFTLIAGRPPFQAESPVELLRAIVEQPAPRLASLVPEVPAALDAALARALAKDPAARPRNPATLAADFEAILAGRAPEPVIVDEPAITVAAIPRPASRPWAGPLAAAAAVVIGLALGDLIGRPAAAGLAAERTEALARAQTAADGRIRDGSLQLSDEVGQLTIACDRLRSERTLILASRQKPAVAAAPAVPQPAAPGTKTGVPATAAPPAKAALVEEPIRPAPRPASTIEPAAMPRTRLSSAGFELVGVSTCPSDPARMVAWGSFIRILASSDGGASWKTATTRDQEIRSASRDDCCLQAEWAGGRVFIPGWKDRLGMLSSDGGRTFASVPLPGPGMHAAALPVGGRHLRPDGSLVALARLDSGSASWAMLRTTDEGRTWTGSAAFTASEAVCDAVGRQLLLGIRGMDGTWRTSLDEGATWFADATGGHIGDARFLAEDALYLMVQDNLACFDATARRWAEVPRPGMRNAYAFVIDPRDPRRLFATIFNKGLCRSTDGGRTWTTYTRILPSQLIGLDLAGARRPRLSAVGGNSILQIDLGIDDGDLFPAPQAVDPALVHHLKRYGAFLANPDSADDLLIFDGIRLQRTRDGARTWEAIESIGPAFEQVRNSQWLPGLKTIFAQLGFAANATAIRSDDDGRRFAKVRPPWEADAAPVTSQWTLLDDGSLAVAWSPRDGTIPMLVSQTRDDGQTWQAAGQSPLLQVLVPTSTGFLLVGSVDRKLVWCTENGKAEVADLPGPVPERFLPTWCRDAKRIQVMDEAATSIFTYDTTTRTWSRSPLAGVRGSPRWRAFAIDPDDPRRIWLAGQRMLVHSTDGGATWRVFREPILPMAERLVFIRGPHPRLMLHGDDGIIDVDAGAAGEALFVQPYIPIQAGD